MKVFVAGATGAVGRRLVPLLVRHGHEVTGMTRSSSKAEQLRALGAEPVVADGLDQAAVRGAVEKTEPEIVIHQMTAGARSFRRFDREFALTNRLRTEGTDHLLAASRGVGVRRFIAQSYGNWNYERVGAEPKSEDDPLDRTRRRTSAARSPRFAIWRTPCSPPRAWRRSRCATGTSTGPVPASPPTAISPSSSAGADCRSSATAPACGHSFTSPMWLRPPWPRPSVGEGGVYNVVDDEPASVSVWLPEYARALGAKPPRRVPAWIGRIAAGEVGISMMTRIRGASNEKAKRERGWEPRYRSWREGFRSGLDGPSPPRLRHRSPP